VNYTEQRVEQLVRFGCYDEKGREIGALITTCVHEFAPLTEEDLAGTYYSFYRKAPGRYFAFRPHATRNASTYGACQGWHYSSSEEERAAVIAKYLADARKRAERKAHKIQEAAAATAQRIAGR
jgi:hypothetical protein